MKLLTPRQIQEGEQKKRPHKPHEPDWRQRRAEYLQRTGRLEQLEAEGLTQFLARRNTKP